MDTHGRHLWSVLQLLLSFIRTSSIAIISSSHNAWTLAQLTCRHHGTRLPHFLVKQVAQLGISNGIEKLSKTKKTTTLRLVSLRPVGPFCHDQLGRRTMTASPP